MPAHPPSLKVDHHAIHTLPDITQFPLFARLVALVAALRDEVPVQVRDADHGAGHDTHEQCHGGKYEFGHVASALCSSIG